MREGFIYNYCKISIDAKWYLEIFLFCNLVSFTGLQSMSKPSRKVFVTVREIKKLKQLTNCLIILTKYGYMVDVNAIQKNVGGELICYIV